MVARRSFQTSIPLFLGGIFLVVENNSNASLTSVVGGLFVTGTILGALLNYHVEHYLTAVTATS